MLKLLLLKAQKNAVRLLARTKLNKSEDKKQLKEAQNRLNETTAKLDLIRLSLQRRCAELPHDSPQANQIRHELLVTAPPAPEENSTDSKGVNLPPIIFSANGLMSAVPQTSKAAAVSGALEVRLMGCQNLLYDVPGRSRGFSKEGDKKKKSKSDDLSSEITAILKLDNVFVGQTSWKPVSQQAWDQRFHFNLDRSRELEIGIYWHDYRSLCAIKF